MGWALMLIHRFARKKPGMGGARFFPAGRGKGKNLRGGAGQGKGQNLQDDAGQNLSISADLDHLLKEGEP